MGSKSFREYLRDFEDPDNSMFDWMDFVGSFRREIHENPGKFPEFIYNCNKLFEKIIPGIPHKIRDKLTLEYLAGMSVLADYDIDRRLSESFLVGNDFDFLVPFYDDPKKYGYAMNALSAYLGLKGELLGKYVFGNYNIH